MSGFARFCAVGVLLALATSCGSAPAKNAKGGAPVILTRDAAIGARYGAPGPRSCSTSSQPASGPLSPAQARAYVICGYEGVHGSETLLLQSKVQVQLGAARPYEHVKDSLSEIDPRKSVYDIRGRSVVYACAMPGGVLGPAQLCTRTETPNNEGKCYQTTFGDWKCTWADFSATTSTDTRLRIAPPSMSEAE